jgi:hypothetical protein
MCGALYATTLLLSENERETITQQFQAEVGQTLCKPIRQENKMKCVDCVRVAAELLAGMKK